jgi:hypothetical protein
MERNGTDLGMMLNEVLNSQLANRLQKMACQLLCVISASCLFFLHI